MIEILQSDRAFKDSTDVGHPRCLCSRCGEVIRNNREGAIRGWDEDRNVEYRYHYRCLGIEKSTEPDWIEELPPEYDPDYPYPEIEEVEEIEEVVTDLGSCCVCRKTKDVFNLVSLPYRTFVPGTGWGNLLYNLPPDGALAVVCNNCIKDFDIENLQDVVYGYPSEKRRKPFLEVTRQEDFGVELETRD